MAHTDGENKQISPVASAVMVVLLAGALTYFGAMLLSFGLYALGEGETLVGTASLVLGGAFVAGVLALVISQARAWLRSRK